MVFFHWVAGKRDPPPSAIYWRRQGGTPKMAPPGGAVGACGAGGTAPCPVSGPRGCLNLTQRVSFHVPRAGRGLLGSARAAAGRGGAGPGVGCVLSSGRAVSGWSASYCCPAAYRHCIPAASSRGRLFHHSWFGRWHKILKLRTDTSGFEEVWSFGINRCESGLSQLVHFSSSAHRANPAVTSVTVLFQTSLLLCS